MNKHPLHLLGVLCILGVRSFLDWAPSTHNESPDCCQSLRGPPTPGPARADLHVSPRGPAFLSTPLLPAVRANP